jgi:hypothetical protein
MTSELWQDKYKNVFQGISTELIQRTVMLLDLMKQDECTPDLLVHLGMQVQEVDAPLPELQVLISNARLVVKNAVKEMQASMRTLSAVPATLEACRQQSREVAQIMEKTETHSKQLFDAIREYLDAHPEAVNAPWAAFAVTPLHECACSGLADLTKHLLERGANRTARNSMGETAAERCRAMGHADLAALIE